MAAYPNTTFSQASRVTPLGSLSLDVAADGQPRPWEKMTSEGYDLRLVHEHLSESDANTIEDFYEGDPLQVVDVSWRGVDYDCYWVSKPSVVYIGGTLWRVESRLIGNRTDTL